MKVYSGEALQGVCGTETTLKDFNGTPLFVGDIVAIASQNEFGIQCFYDLTVVVDGATNDESPFIMDLHGVDVGNDDTWHIKKLKDWEDCINGEHWKSFGFNYRE